jgi:mono/diheme cytochrome c family protein
MRNFILGISFVIVVIVVGGLIYSRLGYMSFVADQSPGPVEHWVASSALDASMDRQAPHVQSPYPATDANLIDGMKFYTMNCALCHGTVTKQPSELGRSFYPPAPQLILQPLDDPEWHFFYAIKHGVRWTGMPAWGKVASDEYIWKTSMFLSRVNQLPPAVKQAIGK